MYPRPQPLIDAAAALEVRLIRHISSWKLDAPPSPNPERPAEIDPSGDPAVWGQFFLNIMNICGLE